MKFDIKLLFLAALPDAEYTYHTYRYIYFVTACHVHPTCIPLQCLQRPPTAWSIFKMKFCRQFTLSWWGHHMPSRRSCQIVDSVRRLKIITLFFPLSLPKSLCFSSAVLWVQHLRVYSFLYTTIIIMIKLDWLAEFRRAFYNFFTPSQIRRKIQS